jgi:hypothetical protein
MLLQAPAEISMMQQSYAPMALFSYIHLLLLLASALLRQ